MRVFITGVKGFVGQELALQCEKQGIEVIGTDIADGDEHNYYKMDINSNNITEIIPEGCDAIIHLAALSRDQDCKNNAVDCFRINVMGTLNLMEAAQQKGAKNFIFASTEWVYDSFLEGEIKDENSFIDIAKHKSEYAFSKLVSEGNLRQKYQHGFCNVTILRFGIIYGPRKSNWSAVESLFHTVSTRDVVEVGSLKTGRCFIHVADIVKGVIKSIGLTGFHLINLQGDHLITLGNIIEVSKRITEKNPSIVEKNPENISVRNVSNEKARTVLNWEPEYNLKKGIESLIGTVA
jgi:UDP-glucose 4-epimerase